MPCHATRLTTPIKLDGVLDEPVWTTSPAITEFTQRDPHEGAPPRQRTEVRVAYDDDALYVGARCYDTAPDSILARLIAARRHRARRPRSRCYLDPLHDRRSGYYFMVNAAGTLFDGTLSNDGWDDDSWDGVWQGKAHVDAQGWTVEMRIPYSQLRFANAGRGSACGASISGACCSAQQRGGLPRLPAEAAERASCRASRSWSGSSTSVRAARSSCSPYVTSKASS